MTGTRQTSFWLLTGSACRALNILESDARSFLPPRTRRLGYVLHNRRKGEALLLPGGALGLIAAQGRPSTFLDLSVDPIRVNCGNDPNSPRADPSWLADAELLMMTVERLGTFKRHVVVGDFTLPQARQP